MNTTVAIMETTSALISTCNLSHTDLLYEEPRSLVWMVTVIPILSIIILITVIGNALVIVAYLSDDKVRLNAANILILNLGVTGFLTGTLILTFNTVIVTNQQWPFGEIACKFWLVLDYVVSMMSVITMVLISWDRYCLVTMGLKYRTFQTVKRLGIILLVSWVTCTIFYSTLAFGWSSLSGNTNIDYSVECEMDYSLNLGVTISVNVVEFFIPFTLLVVLNIAVYINIKRRSMSNIGQKPIAIFCKSPARDEPSDEATTHEDCPQRSPQIRLHIPPRRLTSSLSALNVSDPRNDSKRKGDSKEEGSKVKNDKHVFARHRKAAVVLAVLVGCFMVCWLPYQVASIMFAVCKFTCISDITWEITNNLLWCNSTINPFIYAATNIRFRRNFYHYLLLDRSCR